MPLNEYEFACERNFVESIYRPVQKNILIAEYCSENFGYFNLVDFFYRKIDSNTALILLLIAIFFPICFTCIAAIADKYLSVGMQDLSRRFNLSPTIAAVTLIAFANGSPDVLASMSNAGKASGAFIAVGSLLGGFVFSGTLVVSNVILSSKGDILLPKFAILKELGFYLAAVATICVFGLFKTSGYPLVYTFWVLYVLYIICTLLADKLDNKPIEEADALGAEPKPVEKTIEDEENKVSDKAPEINEEKSVPLETPLAEDGISDEDKVKQQASLSQVFNDMVDSEGGMFKNLILMPLMVFGMFTVSYLANPFMMITTQFFIITSSIAFTLFVLQLTPFSFATLLLIGASISLLFILLEILKVRRGPLLITYELISVFASIAWIKVFSTVIIDMISFIAFYFSLNEVILSSILLSAGNTIGDFFGNGALAKIGEEVMGAIASYSGQVFNVYIGFSLSAFIGASVSTDFDIFALNYAEKKKEFPDLPLPIGNYFLICVISFVILLIALKLTYIPFNGFHLKKPFAYILIAIYVFFFAASVCFGVFSME